MELRVENWAGHDIRFVEVMVEGELEWCAVAKDVASTLEYASTEKMTRRLDKDEMLKVEMQALSRGVGGAPKQGTTSNARKTQTYNVLTEFGIYEAILGSKKKEALEFKKWVKRLLKELRKLSGLEAFEAFRLMDKEEQKKAMNVLKGLPADSKDFDVKYQKANTIANKAVSNYFGFDKMIKKEDMTPEMLVVRQEVLDITVKLMEVYGELGSDDSVSKMVYEKYKSNMFE